ncbi:MAG: CRISPR-associated endonuclease Cas2 [Verrucomicrobiae bacterium]|nr:CRISPR-associated endonuclease Cas2 [Verrucomicrobiae bacterium]MCX7723397.1 CRISPR-associated endonuclease Cas2 [Verrucomicrobiae bacterium]MDW7980822.1 CRISPR-associated endonuclease Cas2 [Verrucomicrobiales bacterium]
MNNSPFSMGWLIAMFDLPVMTEAQRKAAARFRNDLLEHGFLMIQFSVYARPCVNFEQLSKHMATIQKFVPAAGNVRLLFVTDQQWAKSITIIGPNYNQGNRAIDPKVPNQIEFWD